MALHWHAQAESELPAGTAWLSERELERASAMRFAKRRNDYLLGRYTAKRAVAMTLGWGDDALARIEVSNADGGAPELWLDGSSTPRAISLTDRAGWGVCLLGEAGDRVGCDLELVEPRSDAFVRDYLTASERERVAEAAAGEARDELANLIWSAKESALKVLRTGLRRDTRSVEVGLGSGDEGGGGEGWQPLEVRVSEGDRLPGWWTRLGRFVLSVAARSATETPRPLREPADLAAARPSHGWLDEPLAPFPRVRASPG